MWNEQNNQEGTFIFQTMAFASGLEISANIITEEWTRLRASKNLNFAFAPFSGLGWWTPQPNDTRKSGRSFSRTNILDAEITNRSKIGRRSMKNLERHKESNTASTDGSKRREQKGLKDCQRTAAKGERRKATLALREKCQAWWERALPKGPTAGRCPCLKEKVVHSIQNGFSLLFGSSHPSLYLPWSEVQLV